VKLLKRVVSGIMLILLLTGMLTLAFNIQPVKTEWTGTVYIRADGSIDPPDAPIITYDNITYTLTDNITSSGDGIIIERDNIIIDGNGYSVQGTGASESRGIYLLDLSNVTIKNVEIKGFWLGIYVLSSSYVVLSGNNVTENYGGGMWIINSENVILNGNEVTSNGCLDFHIAGILFNATKKSKITNNTIRKNYNGIRLILSSNNTISENMLISNWWRGNVILEDSNNNTISKNYLKEGAQNLMLEGSSGNIISENKFVGSFGTSVYIKYHSNNNKICGNNISESERGILLIASSNNNLSRNLMSRNKYSLGVDGSILSHFIHYIDTSNLVDEKTLYYILNQKDVVINPTTYPYIGYLALINCSKIEVKDLNLTNEIQGLLVAYTSNSIITNNTITNNWAGIWFLYSSCNTVSENNITTNEYGVVFKESSDNCISGNSITANKVDAIELARCSNNTLTRNDIIANEGCGIELWSSEYNSLSENNITNNHDGISLYSSSNYNAIYENYITANGYFGIMLYKCLNNSIFENSLTGNHQGIYLQESRGNTLRGNIMVNNTESFGVWSDWGLSYFVNDVDDSNIIDGKPIYYLVNNRDRSIPPNAGYVGLINCTNIVIANLNLEKNHQGILLVYTANSTIIGNKIENNRFGVLLAYSSNISLCGNDVKNNLYGIFLQHSRDNRIFANNIQNNIYGIILQWSTNNLVYHNNFIRNRKQVHIYPSDIANTLDNGYPSGGNYWSDYLGVDADGDGIGDTPYVIDADNQDRFPLIHPWTQPIILNATVDVNPKILNLRSVGKWIAAYIEFPEGCNVSDIDVSSILLNDTVPVDLCAPVVVGDYDNDTVPDLMVNFNGTLVSNLILSTGTVFGNVTLTLTGQLHNGTVFKGSDTMLVSSLTGDINVDGKVDMRDLSIVALAFGSYLGDSRWNQEADINGDNKINMKDLVIICKNFGETYGENR